MTQPDTETPEQDVRKPSRLVWLVAAVAVAIVGVALILLNQGQEEAPVAADTTPATLAEVVEPTLAPPTTMDPSEAAWQELPQFLGRAGGGIEFRTASFFVPFSFTAVDGVWFDAGEDNGRDAFNMNVEAMAAFVDVFPGLESVEATVDAFTEWQSNYPDTSQMTEPVPATLDGASGLSFELSDLPFEDPTVTAPFTNILGINLYAGQFSEVYVVDVDGQVLIVSHTFAKSYPGHAVPTYTQAEYDTGNAAAKALIATIAWKDNN